MTHDELLDEIGELMPNPSTIDYKTWAALRAVVELTANYKDDSYVNEEFNQGLQTAFNLVIQAIEKELQ